jgi:acetyl esterase
MLPVAVARARFDADFAVVDPHTPIWSVSERRIRVPSGDRVALRVYRPGPGDLAAIVYFHGGGWVLGSVDSHDALCRELARATGAVVVSVDYRRAPEWGFPTAAYDCYAATCWVAESSRELEVDRGRLAVAGDSAGANLAVAVCLLARDFRSPWISGQILGYPVATTDLSVGFDDAYEGFVLYRAELEWHQDNYLPSVDDRRHPLVSPLEHADLRGLPPVYLITATCDPIHVQGELLAKAFARANVSVGCYVGEGLLHGFLQMPDRIPEAGLALAEAGKHLRRVWALKSQAES